MKLIYFGRNPHGSPHGKRVELHRIRRVRMLWLGPLYISWKR